jgi:hypothetical protein
VVLPWPGRTDFRHLTVGEMRLLVRLRAGRMPGRTSNPGTHGFSWLDPASSLSRGRAAADRPRRWRVGGNSRALPDGTPVIVNGTGDDTVRVWRLADGAPLVPPLDLPESVRHVAVNGDVIVTATRADIAVHQLALPRLLHLTVSTTRQGEPLVGVGRP